MALLFMCLASLIAFTNGNDVSCDVGESYLPRDDYGSNNNGPGLCNGPKPLISCHDYCKKQYGNEVKSARCENRGKGQSECVCKLKTVAAGCWGDPHCHSFDGVKFGYQGLGKHALIKPISTYRSLPQFQVAQTNRGCQKYPWVKTPAQKGGSYSLMVNGAPTSIPYTYQKTINGYQQHSVTVTFGLLKRKLIIETSFGLKIVVVSVQSVAFTHADITVYIPRHPDLKGHSCGLLGRWNDDKSDDDLDANGAHQPLDVYSWAFGNSWCYSSSTVETVDQQNQIIHQCEQRKNATKNDKKKHDRLQNLCNQFTHPNVQNCADKLGCPAPAVDECVADLSYADTEADEKDMCNAILTKYTDC